MTNTHQTNYGGTIIIISWTPVLIYYISCCIEEHFYEERTNVVEKSQNLCVDYDARHVKYGVILQRKNITAPIHQIHTIINNEHTS